VRVQLLTAAWCSSCQRDQDVWQRICARRNITLEVVDLETPVGEAIAQRHHLKIMPAVLIDDQPRAIGVQTEAEVEALLVAAEEQTH
jgi:glutaredoxin